MTGRGIDQILLHPGDPTIHERFTRSAMDYVDLAERRSGPIPRRVQPDYVWGCALDLLRSDEVDAVVVNLETAVTETGTPWPGKGIWYRMHPANVDVLSTAGVDVAVLANNHVLDWSIPGLEQTLETLAATGVAAVGAGRNIDEAWAPVSVVTRAGPRVVVLAAGSPSSGIPHEWEAGDARPGVALLADLSDDTIDRVAALVDSTAAPDDIVIVSLHWGPNWGHDILPEHRRFAHALLERAGVHVVHGHSSHHPLGIEVHRDRLIIYGCGDLVTDYEGIHGHEHYRKELGALYLPTIDTRTGRLQSLELLPTKMERFGLNRPTGDEVQWLAWTLAREGAPLGTDVTVTDRETLVVSW